MKLQGMADKEKNASLLRLSDIAFELFDSILPAGAEILGNITENVLATLVGEMTTNVLEHSRADNLVLAVQYWPSADTAALCLVDDGQGIYGSLVSAGRNVSNPKSALERVVREHLSAKDEFGLITRGYGILTARRLLVNNDVLGQISILTGNALFTDEYPGGSIIRDFSNFVWQGTLVHMQFRNPEKRLVYTDYVY